VVHGAAPFQRCGAGNSHRQPLLRAIGITDYLEDRGDINIAKRMAGHSNIKTTELYDRRGDEVSFSEIARVGFNERRRCSHSVETSPLPDNAVKPTLTGRDFSIFTK
jgi:hypothetical protein